MRDRQSSLLKRFTLAVALLSFAAALGAQAGQALRKAGIERIVQFGSGVIIFHI